MAEPTWRWTALSYFFTFITYLLASVVEMGAFILFYTNQNMNLFSWYTNTIGYWVTVVGYVLPWVFAVVQFAVAPVSATATEEFYNNSLFLMIAGIIMWLFTGLIHIFLAPDLKTYAATWTVDICDKKDLCGALPTNASEETKVAYLVKCYQTRVANKCAAKCPLVKKEGQTEEEYNEWCLNWGKSDEDKKEAEAEEDEDAFGDSEEEEDEDEDEANLDEIGDGEEDADDAF